MVTVNKIPRKIGRMLITGLIILAALILEQYYHAQIVPLKQQFDPRFAYWSVCISCIVHPVLVTAAVYLALSIALYNTIQAAPKGENRICTVILALFGAMCLVGLPAVFPVGSSIPAKIEYVLCTYPEIFSGAGICLYILSTNSNNK